MTKKGIILEYIFHYNITEPVSNSNLQLLKNILDDYMTVNLLFQK